MLRAGPRTYAALFLTTLATLTYELLLTRIFSVTMYYHFAFVAISLAMFGMAAGAVVVYLNANIFRPDRLRRHLALAGLWFAITIVSSFLFHLGVPFRPDASVAGVLSVVLTYTVLCIPFTFSGIVVALALTRFPAQVSALYAADLAGAAVGCVVLGPLLGVTDGPTAVIVVGAVAGFAALLFAIEQRQRTLTTVCAVVTLIVGAGAIANTIAAHRNAPWLRLVWVKGHYEPPPLVERWNSFSRVRVIGDPARLVKPSGWGMSVTLPSQLRTRELHLDIDSYAGTELTAFDGDTRAIEHLKYDVTNVVHYMRPASRVLVVGAGGGRDILSALAFGQAHVTGVEINANILDLVNRRFGDFTGHLDRDPRVAFVNDEARSYIARMTAQADIIQISLIDTWAATASGAFVLTENSLYTVEAWRSFLQRLAPSGILTVSRWYYADRPGEIYRIAALASTTLLQLGVANPADHYAIVRARPAGNPEGPDGVGTLLISRDPLSGADLDALEQVAARMKFEIVQSRRHSADGVFAAIADAKRLPDVVADHPLDITAPTDDSPFFFHMMRLRDVFNAASWRDQGIVAFNMKAVGLLGVLLVTVIVLTALCVIVPLARSRQNIDLRRAAPHLLFFASIGFGFMLVEISQVQRLTIFLGHPVYALSVVLFSLLLSSGAGSLSTARVAGTIEAAMLRIAIAAAVLTTFGLLTPTAVRQLEAASTAVRILVSVAILFPIGFCMGMAFPLGMRIALRDSPQLAPWLWGVNGAASVCASVLAVVIAIGAGISAAFWTGTAFYAVSLGAIAWQRQQNAERRNQNVELRT